MAVSSAEAKLVQSTQASASAASSSSLAAGEPARSGPEPGNRLPPPPPPPSPVDDEDRRPSAPGRRAKPSKPIRQKPAEDYVDEDCEDGGDGEDEAGDNYDQLFDMAVGRPMRQMSRIMGGMFVQISRQPDLRLEGASASAFSNAEGYSRAESVVSQNGRRRGLVSETRNGRTQIRRLGDDNEGDELDQ